MLCALLVLLNGLTLVVILSVCCIYRREIATAASVGRNLASNMSRNNNSKRGGGEGAIGGLLLSPTPSPGIRFPRKKD